MNPEEFRKLGYRVIDWIVDYRTRISERPVMARTSQAKSAHVSRATPRKPPSLRRIFRDLDEIILPGLSHWQHPRFFGYFPANGLLASVLGDFLSTGLGVLGLSWQSSPALTELEEVVTDWMRQMWAFPAWSGVIQDTASTSTLIALICARERATDYGWPAEDCRPRSARWSSTSPRTATARWKRPRCWPASAATMCAWWLTIRSTPCARTLSRDAVERDLAAGLPCSDRGHDRHHGHDGARSDRGDGARSRRAQRSGCMSTPRWPDRR